jgi:hypothetical protein
MDELTRIRAGFRARLDAKRLKRAAPLSSPPRYDEVYARGTAWLDGLDDADQEQDERPASSPASREATPPADPPEPSAC